MKFILIIMIAMLLSCSSLDFNMDSENIVHVKIDVDGAEIDITCSTNLKKADGTMLENLCVGFVETEAGIFECSFEIGSDGKPVSKKLTIKEHCELAFEK